MGRIERRKRETWLQFLWMLSDAVAIVVSFPVAYWLRFHSPLTIWIPVTRGIPPLEPYMTAGVVLTLAWLPLFYALGLYAYSGVKVMAPAFYALDRRRPPVVAGWRLLLQTEWRRAVILLQRKAAGGRYVFPVSWTMKTIVCQVSAK